MPSRTDEMFSKGMGAAKQAKAMFKGLHGVFRTLMEQHGEVSALLRRCKSDAGKRGDLWPKIRRELLSHERGELQELYPVLRNYEETRDLAEQHDADAGALEDQIQQVEAFAIGSDEWLRELDELVRLVDDHVKLEESQIFPKAEEVLGEDRARELESEFLLTKQSIMASV